MHPGILSPSVEEANKALIRNWLAAADSGFPADFELFFTKDYRGHLYRIEQGRIAESWGEVDFAGLWRQLTAAS